MCFGHPSIQALPVLSPGVWESGKGPEKKGLEDIVDWKNGLYMSCIIQRKSSIFNPISMSGFTIHRGNLYFLKLVEGVWIVGGGMSGQEQRGPPRPQP